MEGLRKDLGRQARTESWGTEITVVTSMVQCHVSTMPVMNIELRVRELYYDVREPDFGGNEYQWGCASRGQGA